MRQISIEEAKAVGGGACADLTLNVGLTNVSISGSLADWGDCLTSVNNYVGDTMGGFGAHYTTGIPYGAAHVA